MTDLTLTRHAAVRMRQRGYRDRDVTVVLSIATPDDNGGWFLSDRDAQREIDRRRREIADLERLRGTRFVLDGATVITVYRASRRTGGRRMCHQRSNA
jgi:hypothetical protein